MKAELDVFEALGGTDSLRLIWDARDFRSWARDMDEFPAKIFYHSMVYTDCKDEVCYRLEIVTMSEMTVGIFNVKICKYPEDWFRRLFTPMVEREIIPRLQQHLRGDFLRCVEEVVGMKLDPRNLRNTDSL